MIAAKADRTQIPADGSDIAYIDICMQDASGILNPNADKAVSISLDGREKLWDMEVRIRNQRKIITILLRKHTKENFVLQYAEPGKQAKS